jgi:hypothetical protein
MKYIKTYEAVLDLNTNRIQIGDFVLCQYVDPNVPMMDMNKKIKNKVGKLMEIEYGSSFPYRVHFKDDIKGSRWFRRNDILFYAKTIEELELLRTADQYNL